MICVGLGLFFSTGRAWRGYQLAFLQSAAMERKALDWAVPGDLVVVHVTYGYNSLHIGLRPKSQGYILFPDLISRRACFGPAVLTTCPKEIVMKFIQGSFAKRALMVGLIAGSGILAASTFAMPGGGSASKRACEARHEQGVHAKWEARRADHLSELRGKLKLNSEQEDAWNTFISASQSGMHDMRGDRQALRSEFQELTTPQRLDKMLAMSDMRRAKMAERAQAIKAFYAQLSPEQQSVFDAEAKLGRQHWGHQQHRQQS